MPIKRYLILVLFLLVNVNAKYVELTKEENITIDKIYYLKDNNYKLKDLKSKNFIPYEKDTKEMFNFKFEQSSTYWVKVNLKNTYNKTLTRNILIDYPDIRYVQFYEYNPKEKDFIPIKKNLELKRVFNSEFQIKKYEEKIILIRLENHLAPTVFNIFILSHKKLHQKEYFMNSIHGAYIGMMFLAILYFILAFFIMRKNVYIFYIVHILCLILFQLFVQGYPKLFLNNLELLDQLKISIGFFSVLSYSFFALYFIKKKVAKKYIKLLYFLLFILCVFFILYLYEITSPLLLSGLVILSYLTILVLAYKAHTLNIFLSSIIIILGVVIHSCSIIFQIIPLYSYLIYTLSYSNLLEVLIILFMFVIQFKKNHEEKKKSLEQKLQLEKNFSKELKKEVDEKTLELKKINNSLNKRIKEAVEKNQEQERLIFFQSKLATMGETINIITHQWRQPISLINNYLSNMQLKIEYKKDYKEEDILNAIKNSQNNLKYISSTISLFQSYLKPKKNSSNETFELNDTLDRSIKLFEAILEKHKIKIKKDMPSYIKLKGNQEYLIQVLMVLFNNSKDAIVQNKTKNPFIKLSIIEFEDEIVLNFEDNAKGIDIKENIFDPYISGKNSTGLGLFIAKNILKKIFKGDINFENTKNGVKFIMNFPI